MKHLFLASFFLMVTLGFSQKNTSSKAAENRYDSTYIGPRLGYGSKKFIGNLSGKNENNFSNLWSQLTRENNGKCKHIATTQDSTKWMQKTVLVDDASFANKEVRKFDISITTKGNETTVFHILQLTKI